MDKFIDHTCYNACVDSKNDINLNELYGLIVDIAGYVVNNDAILHSCETIELFLEQKLKIAESKAIALDDVTIKIDVD